jgi:serine/threonine protein kinase
MKHLIKQLSSMNFSSSERTINLPTSHLNDNNNRAMGYFDTDEVVLGDRIGSSRYTDLYKVKSIRQLRMAENLVEQRGRDFMKKNAKRKENQYAIKFIQKEYMESSHEAFEAAATSLAHDAEMMAALNHHSIARLRGTSKAGTEAYYNTGRHDGYFLIVDCIQESLGQRLDTWRVRNNRMRLGRGWGAGAEKRDALFLVERLQVAFDVADALEYLHEHGVVHRGISTKSIGFNQSNDVQLHGFGEATPLPRGGTLRDNQDDKRSTAGRYTAPEIQAGERYGLKSDVYSFSMLLCEILSLCRLKSDGHPKDPSAYYREFRFLCSKLPKQLLDLLQRGLSAYNPETRPSMTELRAAIEEALVTLNVSRRDSLRRSGQRRTTQVRFALRLGSVVVPSSSLHPSTKCCRTKKCKKAC